MIHQLNSSQIIKENLNDYKLYVSLRDEHLVEPCSPTLLYTYIIRAEEIKQTWLALSENSKDSELYQELLIQWDQELPAIIKSSVVKQQTLLWNELQSWSREQIAEFMYSMKEIQARYSISF